MRNQRQLFFQIERSTPLEPTITPTPESTNTPPPTEIYTPTPFPTLPSSTQADLGIFDGNVDINNGFLGASGSASFDGMTYTVNGSGNDVWETADACHYLYKEMSGDFVITADVTISGGDPLQEWIKAMMMARQDLTPGSIYISTRVRRDGEYSTQWRQVADSESGSTDISLRGAGQNPGRLRFVKQGNQFSTIYIDSNGKEVIVDTNTLELTDPYYLGFAVTSHETGEIATGTFSNVALKEPAPEEKIIILNENFEDEILDSRISVITAGEYESNSDPGIKDIQNLSSQKAFGFGLSTCGADCWGKHITTLKITFPTPITISEIHFKEMELYGNFGSKGLIYIDGIELQNSEFGRLPYNDNISDTEYRDREFIIDDTVSEIEFIVDDITFASEIVIDDLMIYGVTIPDNIVGVTRSFTPAEYTSGDTCNVKLSISIEPGTTLEGLTIEEMIPAGIEPTKISHGGNYISSERIIRWFFLDDMTNATVEYTVATSLGYEGSYTINGNAKFTIDGAQKEISIGGQNELFHADTTHPIDTNNDFVISSEELLAGALSWKQGNPSPSTDELLSAAMIWKNGGEYTVDQNGKYVTSDSVSGKVLTREIVRPLQSSVQAVRSLPSIFASGTASKVTISLSTTGDVDALTVEETVPPGWLVSEISTEGSYIPSTNTIRWFLLSGFNTDISYRITPSTALQTDFNGSLKWISVSSQNDAIIQGDTTASFDTDGTIYTPTPTPTQTPTQESYVFIYDNPDDMTYDITGETDFDTLDNRNLTIHCTGDQTGAVDWHFYVRRGFGGMKYLGRSGNGGNPTFNWYEGTSSVLVSEFANGPDVNSIYMFKVVRIDDSLGSDDFYRMIATVGFNVEGGNALVLSQPAMPDLDPGQVWICDDILGLKNLVPMDGTGNDVDPSNWRAIQIAWNFDVDPSTVNGYQVYVSVDGAKKEFMGLTMSGAINYFWWTPTTEFTTKSNYIDGPQSGHSYQFTIYLIPLEGGVIQSMTSGTLFYSVED